MRGMHLVHSWADRGHGRGHRLDLRKRVNTPNRRRHVMHPGLGMAYASLNVARALPTLHRPRSRLLTAGYQLVGWAPRSSRVVAPGGTEHETA